MALVAGTLFNNFVMEFLDLGAKEGEDLAAFAGERVFLAGMRVGLWFGLEPAVRFHAPEHWIEGARTDVVAVVAQFFGDPLAVDGALLGVMEDVNFPEADKDFPGYGVFAHALTFTSIE